jgi:hypothetical protein
MADFNVDLAAPQGAGADRVAPINKEKDNFLIEGIVDIFSKGLQAKGKDDAAKRKTSVLSAYHANEARYRDSLATGSKNASEVAALSRANYAKMVGANPEYTPELREARMAVYEGTETGEAQKEVERGIALREDEKKRAVANGYVMWANMGQDAEDAVLSASRAEMAFIKDTEERRKQSAENRAEAAEDRAVGNYSRTVRDDQNKEFARQGLVALADKNLESLRAKITSLMADTSKPPEEKMGLFSASVGQLKSALLSVASTNQEMAAPWQKLVDEIDVLGQKMLDPKAKAADEVARLKAEWDTKMYTGKLLTIGDPDMYKYVVASELVKDPAALSVANTAKVREYLAQSGFGSGSGAMTPIIGNKNEKEILLGFESAINHMNTNKTGDKEKASQEAVNIANSLMKQTQNANNMGIAPAALGPLTKFYSSSAFGSLAVSGKLNETDMQNAKKTVQVLYTPAVRDAVMKRIDETITYSPGRDGGNRNRPADRTVGSTVNIKFSGASVVFEDKPGTNQTMGSSFTRKGLEEAAKGLNSVIRIGAHLEGTTNYSEYWEKNKHRLMPGYFMEGVKEGTIRNGYKFLGGDARSQENWEEQKSAK